MAIKGTVVESPGSGQKFELKAIKVELVSDCSGAEYPLQKKRHSLEFLCSIAHLRPRTTSASVARVRSALAYATHKFFQERGFLYLQTPLITASDCEGAGEMFRVTTLPSTIAKLPKTPAGEIDYAKDFFGKPAFLTVSGQASTDPPPPPPPPPPPLPPPPLHPLSLLHCLPSAFGSRDEGRACETGTRGGGRCAQAREQRASNRSHEASQGS